MLEHYKNKLEHYKELFEGTLCTWPDDEISVELVKDAVPYHCGKPIRIPHIHLETLKKEVDQLVEIGVLEVVDGTRAGPWCAPSFIISKKDMRVKRVKQSYTRCKWYHTNLVHPGVGRYIIHYDNTIHGPTCTKYKRHPTKW